MATSKLQNYIRTHRKHSGLSQSEIAYLLGCRSGSNISRCERFSRKPDLETALAYEVIFGVPVRELFAGMYKKVEGKTIRRVARLARRLMEGEQTKLVDYKLGSLAKAVRKSTPSHNEIA